MLVRFFKFDRFKDSSTKEVNRVFSLDDCESGVRFLNSLQRLFCDTVFPECDSLDLRSLSFLDFRIQVKIEDDDKIDDYGD